MVTVDVPKEILESEILPKLMIRNNQLVVAQQDEVEITVTPPQMLERDPEFYQSKCFVFEGVVYTADFSLIDTTFVID